MTTTLLVRCRHCHCLMKAVKTGPQQIQLAVVHKEEHTTARCLGSNELRPMPAKEEAAHV